MKVSITIVVLCALVGFSAAKFTVKVSGDVTNYNLIDRVLTYAVADPTGYVTKSFTYPENGPLYSNHIIRGIKQIDDGSSPETVEIKTGGVGSKHVFMVVTSQYGKPLATTFEIYGELEN